MNTSLEHRLKSYRQAFDAWLAVKAISPKVSPRPNPNDYGLRTDMELWAAERQVKAAQEARRQTK